MNSEDDFKLVLKDFFFENDILIFFLLPEIENIQKRVVSFVIILVFIRYCIDYLLTGIFVLMNSLLIICTALSVSE